MKPSCRVVVWTGLAVTASSLVIASGSACQPTPPTPAPPPTTTTRPVVAAGPARLTVRVVDRRNGTGDLVVGVYRTAAGFPADPAGAVAWRVLPADGDGVVTVDLPPGTYAAAVLHDENRNGRIDKNFLGIPREGYGVTNNPKPHRRAARFDEATFDLPAGGTTVTVSVQYDFL